MTLEEVMVKVWRQALAERAAEVELDGKRFPVRETPRKHLREVDLSLTGKLYGGWSRIRRRNRAGRSWRARDTR